ncbi:hypothetical protein IE00_16545 [Paracoccus sp. SM22M-07]|nr:hypothetical protein IE00_16545 [Paracoccus sp. SM22M-07]
MQHHSEAREAIQPKQYKDPQFLPVEARQSRFVVQGAKKAEMPLSEPLRGSEGHSRHPCVMRSAKALKLNQRMVRPLLSLTVSSFRTIL